MTYSLFICLLLTLSVVHASAQICNNRHFVASSCGSEAVISTANPLGSGAEHWPASMVGGTHVAHYQDLLNVNAPAGPNRAIGFSAATAQGQFACARARWSSQCGIGNGLTWQTTTNGGNVYWSSDATEIDGFTYGIGNSALNPQNLSNIVAASNSSPSSTNGRSEIILNNSQEMYNQQPQVRWTTTPNACNGTQLECIDFEFIILREGGHYVGLAHDGGQTSIMEAGYRGRIVDFVPCDADRFRRLYCVPSAGNPPVNQPCVTSVREIPAEELGLQIHPMPVRDGYFTVRYTLPTPGRITARLVASDGKEFPLLDEIQSEGDQALVLGDQSLVSGVYLLVLEQGTNRWSLPIVVQR